MKQQAQFRDTAACWPYRPLLINISSVLQEVHHTVKVSFPGGPDQRSGPILSHKQKTFSIRNTVSWLSSVGLKTSAATQQT